MIVDEDVHSAYKVTEFLDHHGVKGQKWGIRNDRTTKSGNYRLTTKQRVGVGAAAVLGTPVLGAATYAILKSNGNTRLAAAKTHGSKKKTERVLSERGSTSRTSAQKQLNAHQDHLGSIYTTAKKDPNALIQLNGRQIVTGKEFTDHVENGGLVSPSNTRIYAQQESPGGKYALK